MNRKFKFGVLDTHPIQYHAPFYRRLASELELEVWYCCEQTSRGQAKGGFDVEFTWDTPLLEGYSCKFLRNISNCPDVNRFFGCNTPEVRRIIEISKYDGFLVHGWNTLSYWQAIRACWKTRTPIFVRGDSNLLKRRSRWVRIAKYPIYRTFIPRFDRYLTVGTRARDYYLHYGASIERTVFCPHTVDNEWFAEQTQKANSGRDAFRGRFGIGRDEIMLLFVGKFIEKKRVGDLIEATQLVSSYGLSVQTVLVGSGPLETKMRDLAVTLSAPIHFAGFKNQTELPSYYASADVLVLPSDSGETWGLVVNEALACGLPVIVSDACGCAEDLVGDGTTGATYPVGNVRVLADTIKSMIATLDAEKIRVNIERKTEKYSMGAAVNGVLEALWSVSLDDQRR